MTQQANMPPIAVIQGGTNRVIQDLMRSCATRWSMRGASVAGVVECFTPGPKRDLASVRLTNLQTGESYPVFQDLGPFATACHLDPTGIMSACESVRQDILHGCDVVILSKFGQLESMRSGLIDAFVAAVETNTPILTAVSPTYAPAWAAFSASLGLFLPPDEHRIEHWWTEHTTSFRVEAGGTEP